MLCQNCEQKLSKLETYGALFLKELAKQKRIYTGEHFCYVIEEFDYQKLKLFLLSILWRAGVSSLEAFKAVQLGIYANELRGILII